MLVLGVEAQQRAPDRAQVRHRRGAAVDQRPCAPVGADPAGEHHLALLLAVAQQLRELSVEFPPQLRGDLEDALDVGLLGAGPHDPRPRASAEEQVERVREHRLAGAGLARQHVQPPGQAQLGLLDQQEILDP